jgi:dipeptidyl aminopeptidase/acylaminoacyl peptidase
LAVEDLLDAPTIAPYSPPAFSPDNRLLAYVVTDNARRRKTIDNEQLDRTGLAWYGIAGDIWISDLEAGTRRNLTGGVGDNWAPSWSPDGRRLAFLSDRASGGKTVGPARLWVWDRTVDALRQLGDADVREGYAGLQWTRDSRSVLVTLFPEELGREGYAALVNGKVPTLSAASGVTAKVFESDPSATGSAPATDQVSLDIWRRDLALIDAETGSARRVVSKVRLGTYILSPDGTMLGYSVLDRAEKPGTGQYLFNIVAQDLATGRTQTCASDVRLDLFGTTFSWSPTGKMISYRTAGPLATDELFVVPRAGGAASRVANNPAVDPLGLTEIDRPVWDPGAGHVFFIRKGVVWRAAADASGAAAFATLPDHELETLAPRQGRLFSPDRGRSAVVMTTCPSSKRVGFAKVDLQTGAVSLLFEEDKRYGGYGTEPTVSPDGARVVYVAEDALEPADLFVLGGDLSRPRKVSQVAPALTGRVLGKAETIEWRSVDGETMRGALVYPAGYDHGKTYPLIVKVYGGSSISNDLNRFGYALAAVENLQLYATRGYAVLLADSKLSLGTPMADLMKSVMPGVDKAVELGVADPARLGITGHSYGGYSTLALIVQTSRFKAAVMRAGLGDLIGMYGSLMPDGTNYGLAWAESGQGRMGGSPWEVRERYLENSAVFYLDRVQTPLLIVHGGADRAVPVYMADEIFTGLRRLGKRVAYRRYEGEDHWEGTWSRANQVDVLDHVIAWFDRYLKGGES